MRRLSQGFLQWLFMFRLVALVLTCLTLRLGPLWR